MAGIIQIGGQSGLTVYGVIRDSAGNVWNGSAFAAFNASNWSTYVNAMTEQGSSGYYKASFPSGITIGKYSICVHTTSGSPAAADEVIAFGTILWDGTSEEGAMNSILQTLRLHQLISATGSGLDAVAGSFLDLIMNKDGAGAFDRTTDSLEAIRDAGSTALTPGNIAAAVWDEDVSIGLHAIANSAGERLRAIDDKLPSGSISGFDPTTTRVNLNADQSTVTIGTINNLSAAALALVKAQVVAALNVDSMPELISLPSSTPTVYQALMLAYQALRNRRTASASSETLSQNSGAVIATAPVSDDGFTFTKEQFS